MSENKYWISEKQINAISKAHHDFAYEWDLVETDDSQKLYEILRTVEQQPLKPRKLVFKLITDNIDLKVWECNLGKLRYTINKYEFDYRYYIYQNHGIIKYYASYNRCVTWLQNHFNQMYEEMSKNG